MQDTGKTGGTLKRALGSGLSQQLLPLWEKRLCKLVPSYEASPERPEANRDDPVALVLFGELGCSDLPWP